MGRAETPRAGREREALRVGQVVRAAHHRDLAGEHDARLADVIALERFGLAVEDLDLDVDVVGQLGADADDVTGGRDAVVGRFHGPRAGEIPLGAGRQDVNLSVVGEQLHGRRW